MKNTMRVARILVGAAILMAIEFPAAQAGTLIVPAGTQLHVVLDTTLSTKNTKAGDRFRSRLVMSVFANERELLPLGTMVEGIVVSLQGPGRASGRAEMQLRPDKLILPDGRDYSLAATLASAKTDDGTNVDAKEGTIKGGPKDGIKVKDTAKGVGTGAVIGAVAAGGTGAAIGAGAMGAVALLHQVFKRGKDASLPAGSELVLEMTREVSYSDMQEVPPGTISEPPQRKLEESQ